jgi:hypothetical protein
MNNALHIIHKSKGKAPLYMLLDEQSEKVYIHVVTILKVVRWFKKFNL